jgi:hypothetical protein
MLETLIVLVILIVLLRSEKQRQIREEYKRQEKKYGEIHHY